MPEHFQMAEGYALFRPLGRMSFMEAVDLACKAITFAREKRIPRLLVDATLLDIMDQPATWERFEMGRRAAEAAVSQVIVALALKDELIAPDRFGVKVARNRGLLTNVFPTEPEALAWLLDSETRPGAS